MTKADVSGPMVIAHRGSRLLWPENTMAAFQGAVDLGMRWLETDLHLARDGVVVCIHDDTVDRTTDGAGAVGAFSSSELGLLDAGRALSSWSGERLAIPTLEEVLVTYPDVGLVLDLKQDRLEQYLLDLLHRLDATHRVVVGSFSDRRLRTFRTLAGDAVATSGGPWRIASIRFGLSRGAVDAIQVPERFGPIEVVSASLVGRYRARGLATHVWTVNDESDMHRLLEWGVTGIITDRPDLARRVFEERGIW